MPRLDRRVVLHQRLTSSERALVLLMRDLVNDVRTQAAMPPLSRTEIEERLVQLLRSTAREDRT
jgi:hypothetical protein